MPFINDYYKNKVYTVKDDIVISSEETLKKGTLVKIWIEVTVSILKVKCYPQENDRESSVGKLVTYIQNDKYKEKKFKFDDLDEIVEQKLMLYKFGDVVESKQEKKK